MNTNIKDSAKTILCFGDSNTWGENPETGERHPRSVRWPSVLQKLLGDDYEVISEGLPGRTLVAHDLQKPHRTGITHLRALIESHNPIDWVIIMLGTNDAKKKFKLSAKDISEHLEQTIKLIRDINLKKIPKVLIVCPPPPVVPDNGEIDPRMVHAPEIFKSLPLLYKSIAKKHGCDFLNAGNYISSSKIGGYHLDADAHIKLAEVVANAVKNRF